MKPPVKTGDLKYRFRFDQPTTTDDPAGGKINGWEEYCTRRAAMLPQRGGEGVQAQRLQGVQPAILIVRYDSKTSAITPDMRAVLLKDGEDDRTFAIKTAMDMEGERQFITMQAVSGDADA